MIDVLTVAFSNYRLFQVMLEHHLKLTEDIRFVICDATPDAERRDLSALEGERVRYVDYTPPSGFDGESHGAALDLLVKSSDTDIIGIMDHDFFWFRPDIVEWVDFLFMEGYKAVGAMGWYPPISPDWQNNIDVRHPGRAGNLAPVCWGEFIARDLALSDTWVITREEAPGGYETGWRIRERIINESIKNLTLPAFQYANQPDSMAGYFGTPTAPVGMHWLKGVNRRDESEFRNLSGLIEIGESQWH